MPSGPQVGKEFALEITNDPTQLGRITEALAEAEVNIDGILCCNRSGIDLVRFITDDPARTSRILKDQKIPYSQKDVVTLSLLNRPGELHRRVGALSDAGIRVESLYPTFLKEGPAITFEVANPVKAAEVLRE